MTTIAVRLEPEPLDPAAELGGLIGRADGAGGMVSFVGIARPASKAGTRVDSLHLEHHPHLTVASLEHIASSAAERFAVEAIAVVHRIGRVPAGAPVVIVAASAVHRRSSFEAVDYIMDRLKTDAIFWKREQGPGGTHWVEPSESDYIDRDRWG